jgi:hypothetical protein
MVNTKEVVDEQIVAQDIRGHNAHRKKRLYLQHVAIFISLLVIMLPIYSSSALAASVSITKNTGQDGFDGFMDAQSDIWSVDALITGVDGNILPEQVQLEVGSSSQVPFSSCSQNTCSFLSSHTGGIPENEYLFTVTVYDVEESLEDSSEIVLGDELASDSEIIVADGSAPHITDLSVAQTSEGILVGFSVNDKPDGCIGLATIDIIDSDSGIILQSINVPNNDCSFNYAAHGGTSGILPVAFDGEGKRHIKVRATDVLGHSATSSAADFDTDFVVPYAHSSTFSVEDLGEFIGTSTQSATVSVEVTECGTLGDVRATSSQMDFFSQKAECHFLNIEECLFECSWDGVQIMPSGNY